MYKVQLDNLASLHVFKNEALVTNIGQCTKFNVRSIDGSQTATVQMCDIRGIDTGFKMCDFNKNGQKNLFFVKDNQAWDGSTLFKVVPNFRILRN